MNHLPIPPLTALRLPFLFDAQKLDTDLSVALAQQWKSHYNSADYAGDWKIIALRSENGREDSITSKDLPDYHDTPLMAHCPYFREIAEGFRCEKQAIRLMQLAPGSRIKEHRDAGLGYANGVFRIHIPIRTHEQVLFVVNGHEIPMRRAECWYANFDLPHRVENNGSEPRIHLVLDGLRNAWSDRLFAENGFDLEAADNKAPKPEDIPKIIEQLERMGTDTARSMIADLKRQLGS